MLKKINSWCFYIILATIAIIIATASYLPMLDLPQHAAQIQALQSLLFDGGKEPWFETVEINYFTPYWIGYLSIFLMSFLFSIQNAINIIVSLSFILFVVSFSNLRNKLNAPSFLDWILIPCFFGFSYQFGLLTFTLSISVGVYLLLKTLMLVSDCSKRRICEIVILGVILYFSHILIFLFFCMIAVGVIVFYKKQSIGRYIVLLTPFFILSLLLPLYFILPMVLGQSNLDIYFNEVTHSSFKYGSFFERIDYLFIYQWALIEDDYRPFSLLSLSLTILIIPFIAGCKLSKNTYKYIPLICFFIIWFALPEHLFHTTFVYQRFSIFFIPFYILIFELSNTDQLTRRLLFLRDFFKGLWIIIALALVVLPIKDIFKFNEEVKDFDQLLVELPENQLTMSLVYNQSGGYAARDRRHAPLYVYFPVWYQVIKGGWVEYNFAWFSPQIIRYKSNKVPENRAGFAWNPWMFSQFNNCDYYGMIIVYKANQEFNQQFQQSTCSHKLFKQKGDWSAYQL